MTFKIKAVTKRDTKENWKWGKLFFFCHVYYKNLAVNGLVSQNYELYNAYYLYFLDEVVP